VPSSGKRRGPVGAEEIQGGNGPKRERYRVRHLLDALGPPAHGMGSVLIDALVDLVKNRGASPPGY
jgi:hypothetical protein